MAHYADKYNRSLKKAKESHSPQETAREYQEKSKKIRKEKNSFLHRTFDYRDYIIAAEGYEGIMLTVYILTVPYLVALAFLFLFVARSSFYMFLELDLTSYFIIWAIGYEICAVFALIFFFYSWITDNGSYTEPSKPMNGRTKPSPRGKK